MFTKGKSGNYSGRPKKSFHIATLAKAYSKEALDVAVDLMRNARKSADRLAAVKIVLAYAEGLPRQAIEVTGETTHYTVAVPAPSPEPGIWQQEHKPKQLTQ